MLDMCIIPNLHVVVAMVITVTSFPILDAISVPEEYDVTTATPYPSCPPRFYHDARDGACTPCTRCPKNYITRRMCTLYRDTECGPFYEFVAPELNQPGEPEIKISHKVSFASGTGGVIVDEDGTFSTNQTAGPLVQHSDWKWRKLSYSLVGVLAVMTTGLFIYYVVTQRRRANKQNYSVAFSDPEDPSVIYRTIVVPNNYPTSSTDAQNQLSHLDTRGTQRDFKHKLLWRLFHPRASRGQGRSSSVRGQAGSGLVPLQMIPEIREQRISNQSLDSGVDIPLRSTEQI